jgi:PKD repeat protein
MGIKHSNNKNMFYRFLLLFTCSTLLFSITTSSVSAQLCADTQPTIAGAQVVVNNQPGVIYSTPNIPGHTYAWTVTGGTITSGTGLSQITVLWGVVGSGTVSVTETNPSIPCFTTVSKAVRIQPLLVSYFFYKDTSCYGNELSFWDISKDTVGKRIVLWTIDFGDGTPMVNTAIRPWPIFHTYAPPFNKTYTITWIVTNSEGSKDTIFDAVYVNPDQYIPNAQFTYTVPNCSYEPVSFDASSSTTPPGTGQFQRFAWYFGDPASGAANTDSCKTCSNVTHLFSGPGTYTVLLRVLNTPSCYDTIEKQVVIQQSVPTAKFTFSSPTCQNNPVSFNDNSTFPAGKDIVTWVWNFGDGSSPKTYNAPASPNTTHVFPALGPYTVGLRVINNLGCVDSAYHSVTLTPSPVANFSFAVPCAGDTLKFTNSSSVNNGPAIVSYDWNFGDPASGNNTSTMVNPGHVFSDSGTFMVTLAIANVTGCPDTVRKTVHVNPKPLSEFTWNVGSMNNVIDFHLDTLPPYNIGYIGYMCTWNFGDGGYGYGHNPQHTYLGSNNWTATLTVTDTLGCSSSVGHVVYVPEIPMAFYSSNSPVCLNTPMHFHDLSTVPSPPFGFIQTWIWDFGDGSPKDTIHFPGNPDVNHTFLNAGTYQVSLTVIDNSGFNDTYSHSQIVLTLPIANFFYSTPCASKLVQFTDASFPNNGGNIYSTEWDFGDPLSGIDDTSQMANPTHIFSTGGVFYTVRLIVRNNNNCVDTMLKQVYVFPAPPVDFTRDTACLGTLLHFYANTTITHVDSIVTWQWDFGDGSAFGTDPINTSHSYSAAGIYIATLTVTDHHGCTNSVSHQVKVNPKPIPEFSWTSPACSNSAITYTDLSIVPSGYTGYIAKWHWDFNDGKDTTIIIPGIPDVTHTFATSSSSHVVTLTVWSSDSCFMSVSHTIISVPSPIADFSVSTVTCMGSPVSFTDHSQVNGGGSITLWDWNFGDPVSGSSNSSTAQNAIHTFNSTGTFVVTLIVHNSTGCSDTMVRNVTVNQLPIANFTADTVCLNNITHFTDNSTANSLPGGIVNWAWDFGDGTYNNTMQNPPHTYSTYGTFNVKLTVTNANGCTKDTTKQVLVHPLPNAAFSFSTPNCFGAVVSYSNLSTTVSGYLGSIVKWEWNFNDSFDTIINAPGNPNITHTFLGTGLNHNVTLTVTTSDGCTATISHLVTSIPAPLADFSYSTNTCAGQITQFTDHTQLNGGGSIVSWNWNFGDPLSGFQNTNTGQNPIHTFTGFLTYNVTLIVTNTSGCMDTIVKTVSVNQLPLVKFAADTVCLGSPTTFTDHSIAHASNIISWNWDFGDGVTNGMQNPIHLFSTYGVHTVTLTVTNSNGCIHDTSELVLVHPLPIAAFSFPTPNCLGAPVQFTNQSTTVPGYLGSIVRWYWDFGDGQHKNVIGLGNPNVTHAFSGNTSFVVTLTVTTTDSCTASISHTINLMPSPIASFSFPTSDCQNQSVQFTDNSQPNGGGNISIWSWNFGDPLSGALNNSSSRNPAHTFVGPPGVFTVTEIVLNASGCTDTITQPVTIIAHPVADFSADTVCLGSLTVFTDHSNPPGSVGTISSWHYDFGDGNSQNVRNPQYAYAAPGVYSVTLTVTTTEGCMNSKTKSILVLGAPVASFTTSAPTCAGDSTFFTNLSTTPHGTIHQWLWNFGDGSTKTVTFPSNPNVGHKYTAGGTYTVSLTVTTSDNCTATISMPVQIQFAPLVDFTYGPTRCVGMPMPFTDLSQMGGGSPITQWLWNFGDPNSGAANSSTVKNPTHAFTHNGNFTVKLKVTNATGCFASDSLVITVNAGPLAKFIADTACVSGITHFTDQSVANSGTIASWLWDFGEPGSGTLNSSTLQNPSHTYLSPGSFTVTLTVTNTNSCSHDTTRVISVSPKPQAMFQASVACVGDSTSFQDLSIAPGSGLTAWHWEFGDGGTADIQTPKHKYTSASTFNVVLTVTNLSGCKDSVMVPITTHPTPVAAFTYTSFFCPAGQVAFQDQSHGVGSGIATRQWIFYPGSESSLINPTFIFPKTDTTYLVQLIVTDTYGCSDTVADSVHVKPGFKFTFSNDTVCFKDPTHFTAIDLAKGDSLYSIAWNFGDPNSGPNNNSYNFHTTHTFTQPGIYAVKLRVTDADNCTDSIYHDVTVHALPAPAFVVTSTPCDSVVRFHDTSTFGSGTVQYWIWNFGDGTIDTIHASVGKGDTSHIYSALGVYHVKLTVVNTFGCSDTLTKPAEELPCILADFSHADTLMCARYKLMFSDSSLPASIINQWHWEFGDGHDTTYIHHAGHIQHTFALPGTYNVKLIIHATVLGSGRTFNDSIIHLTVIHATPLAYFSDVSVCKKQFTVFKDTSNTFGTPVNSWRWTFGESYSGSKDSSVLKNPTHKYDTAGVYNVKMVVENRFGCKDSILKTTRVYEIPIAKFNHSVACSGNPTYFTDTTSIADTAAIVKWNWDFGEATSQKDTSMIQDPIHRYKTDGDYIVRLIVKDQHGCFDTVDSTVTVHVTPVSSFTFTDNVNNMTGKLLFNNKSTGAETYFWDFGNGQTSTDENPVISYANDGTYLISLISSNSFNCTDTTYYQYEFIFKGLYIPNAFAPSSLTSGANVFAPIGINLKQFKIEVFDNWGNMVWSSVALDGLGRPTESWDGMDINGNLLPSGTFMWKAMGIFIDNSEWVGSDIGKGSYKTTGTVTLIR